MPQIRDVKDYIFNNYSILSNPFYAFKFFVALGNIKTTMGRIATIPANNSIKKTAMGIAKDNLKNKLSLSLMTILSLNNR